MAGRKPGQKRESAKMDVYNERIKTLGEAVRVVHPDEKAGWCTELVRELVSRAITLGFATDAEESNIRQAEKWAKSGQKGHPSVTRVHAINRVYQIVEAGFYTEVGKRYGEKAESTLAEIASTHIEAVRKRVPVPLVETAEEPGAPDFSKGTPQMFSMDD